VVRLLDPAEHGVSLPLLNFDLLRAETTPRQLSAVATVLVLNIYADDKIDEQQY
jgi:hypothetical protein